MLEPGQGLCQDTRVPAGTRAVEVPLRDAAPGDGLRLRVLERRGGGRGRHARRPARGGGALRAAGDAAADVAGQVCLDQGDGASSAFLGSLEQCGLTQGGKPTPGGVSLAYYRPGEESLLAMAPEVARRIGFTRGHLGGAWRAVAIVILFAAGVALSAWLLAALARGRAPRRVALAVAGVAVLNSLAWGLLTPTFQVPDEPFHTSYVQDLAEHGEPPRADPACRTAPPTSWR